MDRKLRDDWCAALRSGKYEQGRERLRRGLAHCCLGVLCDVLDPNGWELDEDQSPHGPMFWRDRCFDNSSDTYLPRSMKWCVSGEHQNALARLNDDGKTFAEIADWIEANIATD